MSAPHPLRLDRDLRGKDYSGANLAGIVFEGADLYRTTFDGANLSGASFVNCFVAEASFQQADCSNLQAIHTNFYRANFGGADLSDALLKDCVLAAADLRGARLRRVTLTLDCNSFEELRLDHSACAELAYLFGRAKSPHRHRWLALLPGRRQAQLARVFQH